MNGFRTRLAWLLAGALTGLVLGAPVVAERELMAVLATGLWLETTGVVGALVASRRPKNPIGWLLLGIALLVGAGVFAGEYAYFALEARPGSLPGGRVAAWLSSWLAIPGFVLFAFLMILFPQGKLRSAAWRAAGWASGVGGGVGTVAVALRPGPIPGVEAAINPLGLPGLKDALGFAASAGLALPGLIGVAGVVAQLVRLRHAEGDERQQLKWFAYAAAVLAAALLFAVISPNVTNELSFVFAILGLLALPVAIGIAVLRYRLYDIDVVINRTLVYGALTVSVVALYVAAVSLLGSIFEQSVGLGASLVATGLVAVLFQPLRLRLQRAVDRVMYGDRMEPYAAVSRLGRQLEEIATPEAVLPSVAENVARSLKVPYVEIELLRSGKYESAARWGSPTQELEEIPLIYQREAIGRMRIARRSPTEALSGADRRLLADLGSQAGAAAYAVRLTAALQRSREQLIAAREEERRRLRRDLHDGLGPELAGVALGLGAARNVLNGDDSVAGDLLARLEAQTKTAVKHIRGLVEGLRPPALDELGLVPAIREKALQFAVAEGRGSRQRAPEIRVEAPDSLPPLPAAVEVAAFRIVLEALTNATRHADASTCVVRFEVGDGLDIVVGDDGKGMPETYEPGIGLASMRERAAELGGECTVESRTGAGTYVRVHLPLSPQ